MKKKPPSLFSILAAALAVIAGGAFCFLFFPWPLWIIVWSLFSIIGLVQILAPTRRDDRNQSSKTLLQGDFSGFDNQIKWDKFSALERTDKEKGSWAKPRQKPVDKKEDEKKRQTPIKPP